MNMVLPPKRFQQVDDPLYDPIRHKPYFHKLERRRTKLPFLKEAYRQWKTLGITQLEAAANVGVDSRELRDYQFFVEGRRSLDIEPDQLSNRANQYLLNVAYEVYCQNLGDKTFMECIESVCNLTATNPRHLMEMWDTDPTFYPKNYPFTPHHLSNDIT